MKLSKQRYQAITHQPGGTSRISTAFVRRLASTLSAPTLRILALPHLPYLQRELLRTTLARKKGVRIPRNGRLLTWAATQALRRKLDTRRQLRPNPPGPTLQAMIEMREQGAASRERQSLGQKTECGPQTSPVSEATAVPARPV